MLKKFPKIIIIFFLTVFVIQLICLFFLWIAPAASQAASAEFKPQVIQELGYTFNSKDATTGNIANLVKAIYKYAIGIVGILAAVVLMIGGVIWIVAGGSATMIGEAKSWIGASLTGLVLALTSYLILATVNPALVDLTTTTIKTVENSSIGCCQQTNNEGAEKTCGMITASQCNGTWLGATYQCSNTGSCSLMKDLATGVKDCKPSEGGQLLQKVFPADNVENICKNTTCAPKTVSNNSYYVSVGASAGGYCCICNN